MPLAAWFARSQPQAGAPGLRALGVGAEEWRSVMRDVQRASGRLLALWASRDAQSDTVHALVLAGSQGLHITLALREPQASYPGIEDLFPAAARLQRALRDLSGVDAVDPDRRPWLRHACWPQGYRPLIDAPVPPPATAVVDQYEFVRVGGEGVHEIAVGPVHAGTIEPGHFRFSVVGEKVLRLEERLGYTHKGIEQHFARLPILTGHRLAARICGDSTVAYSWAYVQALEAMAAVEVPRRSTWLRALCLELERLANHLGDLGALGNDAGFAFGLSQFSRLKELLLRATQAALGSRYLMDVIVPGGTHCDLADPGAAQLAQCVRMLAAATAQLRTIYDEHEGLRDRFAGAGTVTPDLAARLGLIGLAGRASGQRFDVRVDLPCGPYPDLAPVTCARLEGDVAARVAVRFDEVQESCRLIHEILANLPGGMHRAAMAVPPAGATGIGLIEGWRGPVMLALQAGEAGAIHRCHPHDPSWQNWPVIEHAIIGNIVPDFPLINKSFNLAYSGHDL
ncbi:MAG: NADH-quinone oxidoreductase subunit C [Proteobacteria bacterium]|nr:NADH-quinone oxidoreductase subunit C [Pseudomonadota bacterium]